MVLLVCSGISCDIYPSVTGMVSILEVDSKHNFKFTGE
jgi:hypothetical protein